jgi:hypothetical protein
MSDVLKRVAWCWSWSVQDLGSSIGEQPMGDKSDEKRWALGKSLLIAIAALAVYVASAGPFAWSCTLIDPSRRGPLWKIGRIVYEPITGAIKATNTINLAERYMKHFR